MSLGTTVDAQLVPGEAALRYHTRHRARRGRGPEYEHASWSSNTLRSAPPRLPTWWIKPLVWTIAPGPEIQSAIFLDWPGAPSSIAIW